jgi:hypothetical protein
VQCVGGAQPACRQFARTSVSTSASRQTQRRGGGCTLARRSQERARNTPPTVVTEANSSFTMAVRMEPTAMTRPRLPMRSDTIPDIT